MLADLFLVAWQSHPHLTSLCSLRLSTQASHHALRRSGEDASPISLPAGLVV